MDYGKAVKWYRMAAEQGSADAQFALGVMYGNGDGVPRDYSEAVKWWRKAAEQGFAPAQYNLGKTLQEGQGVPQDQPGGGEVVAEGGGSGIRGCPIRPRRFVWRWRWCSAGLPGGGEVVAKGRGTGRCRCHAQSRDILFQRERCPTRPCAILFLVQSGGFEGIRGKIEQCLQHKRPSCKIVASRKTRGSPAHETREWDNRTEEGDGSPLFAERPQ